MGQSSRSKRPEIITEYEMGIDPSSWMFVVVPKRRMLIMVENHGEPGVLALADERVVSAVGSHLSFFFT